MREILVMGLIPCAVHADYNDVEVTPVSLFYPALNGGGTNGHAVSVRRDS